MSGLLRRLRSRLAFSLFWKIYLTLVACLAMVALAMGALVHLAGGELLKVHPMGANGDMSEVDEVLTPSADGLFDDMAWWGAATKAARAE